MKGLNSVDETGRKIASVKISVRVIGIFPNDRANAGYFPSGFFSRELTRSFFPIGKVAAPRRESSLSNALFPSAFEIRAKFESIANRKLVNKYMMCPCTIKKISNSWKKREKREKVEVRRDDMDLRETKRSKHAYARHVCIHRGRSIQRVRSRLKF